MSPYLDKTLLTVALGVASGLACAQASPANAPELVASVQRVEVDGHYANGVGTSDAASQGSVRGERLTDLPLLRPGEVLETVPGLVVTQHSGDGKANQYFLRGYNLDHGTDFATWVDGLPINMPTNAHGQGYTDLNFLIPELVDRIDYRKGPYFAEDGDFSSAGSARIRLRDRLDAGILDLATGSDGYRRVLLAGSSAVPSEGGAHVLGALELQHDDGPWTTPEGVRKVNGLLKIGSGDPACGWSATALHYANHWTATDQVPLALIDNGTLGRYSALDPTDGGNTTRSAVAVEWHARDDLGYTNVSAYAEHYRLKLWSDFTWFEADPLHGDQFEQQETRNLAGGQAVRGWQHLLFGNEATTEAGVSVRHDHVGVGLLASEARIPLATVSNDRVGETMLGAYVQNTTTWRPWLRTLLGLRDDRVVMDVKALKTLADGGHASGNRLSPKLSLILGPWDKTEFFANAGRGFHSNDARGVVGTAGTAAAVPALVASKGAELGLRTEFVPGLQTSLAAWRLDSDSELVYSADAGTTEAKGASRRRGVELNNHLVLDRWLMMDADLAWTHARYAHANANGEQGDRVVNAIGRVGLFGLTLHELGPWSAGMITRWIGSSPLSQDGRLAAPSSWITNLQVRRTLTRRISLRLDVLNLFDRRFHDIAYAQDYRAAPAAPVVPEGVTVHPGEPREFRVGLDASL
jgi:outer membrane receptor protein involved in Fe transport